MSTKDLTYEQTLLLITEYQNALMSVLSQKNNTKEDEDIVLLNHMISNLTFIKTVMQVQPPSNKFTWKVMTLVFGAPQVLNSTQTYKLQYDSGKNINQNMQSLYSNLLLNNTTATENLKKHIDRNNTVAIISALLAITSIILTHLIAPWSAWGVSCLMPLYSTLALPLVVILFLSIGLEVMSQLHSSSLKKLYHNHNVLEVCKNSTDDDGILKELKTVRFFQPSPSNNLLPKVEEWFNSRSFVGL